MHRVLGTNDQRGILGPQSKAMDRKGMEGNLQMTDPLSPLSKKTYPEMDRQIVGILRVSEDPSHLYAAQRIEDLEARIAELGEIVATWEAKVAGPLRVEIELER